MIADVFVYLQYILCVDDAVAIYIAIRLPSLGGVGGGHELVDAEDILGVDGTIAVHVFGWNDGGDEDEAFADAAGVPSVLTWEAELGCAAERGTCEDADGVADGEVMVW